uniref:Uncharacterized protein n=1 Tax=Lygus hesperus TaxID=30085 RepID=A0A0A9Z030_LYGHE
MIDQETVGGSSENNIETVEPEIETKDAASWWSLLLCSRGNFVNSAIMLSTVLHLAIREVPNNTDTPALALAIRSQTKGHTQTSRESRFVYHVDDKNIFKIELFHGVECFEPGTQCHFLHKCLPNARAASINCRQTKEVEVRAQEFQVSLS